MRPDTDGTGTTRTTGPRTEPAPALDLIPHENRWIRFCECDRKSRKTRIIACVNKSSGDTIGVVAWYGPWRQYCFFPEPRTVFNHGCMTSINGAIETLMKGRRDTAAR